MSQQFSNLHLAHPLKSGQGYRHTPVSIWILKSFDYGLCITVSINFCFDMISFNLFCIFIKWNNMHFYLLFSTNFVQWLIKKTDFWTYRLSWNESFHDFIVIMVPRPKFTIYPVFVRRRDQPAAAALPGNISWQICPNSSKLICEVWNATDFSAIKFQLSETTLVLLKTFACPCFVLLSEAA